MEFTYVDAKALVATELKSRITTVPIFKADPLKEADIPSICVNLASDEESSQVLGDELGTETDPATGATIEYKGTFFAETLEIRVWHRNADERDKLYIQTKASLFDMRSKLLEMGLVNIRLHGGRDESDSTQERVPFPVFWGTILMDYLNPLEVSVTYEPVESITVVPNFTVTIP